MKKDDPSINAGLESWRPKWAVWRQVALSSLQAGPLLLVQVWSPHRGPGLWITGSVVILMFVVVPLVMAYRERKHRVPAPRFWKIESEFRLRIRSTATGELLLQSPNENLRGQDLRDAWLPAANFQGVDLSKADLRGAILRGAHLQGTILNKADLSGADLRGANLSSALILSANFQNADLCGANFRGVSLAMRLWDPELGGADFTGARYSRATRWPAGFEPQARGCILCDDPEAALPIPAHPRPDLDQGQSLPRPAVSQPAGSETVLHQARTK